MRNTHDLSHTTRGHMSDADRLMDCLCSAKERAKLYASAALESTNNGVREFFLAMHGEETHNQEILFSFLHTRGFYPTRMAPQERIREVRERYRQIHDQMGLTDNPSFRRYQTADPRMHPAEMQNPKHFHEGH
ncbi:MAG: spore coat protein [Bacillota bacterium]